MVENPEDRFSHNKALIKPLCDLLLSVVLIAMVLELTQKIYLQLSATIKTLYL